jgi:hypothetical protein
MFRQQFGDELTLTPTANGKQWKLHHAFSYETHAGILIEVPAGFLTDLASVPRFLWPIYPPFGSYTRAAVLHDWLYAEHRGRHNTYTRAAADTILWEAMVDCGTPWHVRWVVWSGVRLGGWSAWSKGAVPCVAH